VRDRGGALFRFAPPLLTVFYFNQERKKIMAKGKKVLTTGQVAEICNVASRTVGKWFDRKLLNGYRIPGSRDRRIPVPELIAFMKKHNIPGHDSLTP
jgi:excisionase family DNA binding protein